MLKNLIKKRIERSNEFYKQIVENETEILQGTLNLMEQRAERLKNRHIKSNNLAIGMESIVCGRIRQDYPDLVKSYKDGEITYEKMLEVYDQLVLGDFDNEEGES